MIDLNIRQIEQATGWSLGSTWEVQSDRWSMLESLTSFAAHPTQKTRAVAEEPLTQLPVQCLTSRISSLGRASMVETPAKTALSGIVAVNMLGAFIAGSAAAEDQTIAEMRGDRKEVRLALMSRLEALVRFIGGIAGAALSSAQLFCQTKASSIASNAVRVATQVATVAGLMAEIGFGLSSGIDAALTVYRFYETYKFQHLFQEAEARSQEEGFACLAEFMQVNSEERLQQLLSDPSLQAFLEKKACNTLPRGEELFAFLTGKNSLEKKYREQYATALHLPVDACNKLSLAALVGLFIEEGHRASRQKEARIKQLSPALVETIEKAAQRGLFARLQAGGTIAQKAQAEYQLLSQQVHHNYGAQRRAVVLRMAVNIVGVVICSMGALSLLGLSMAPPLWLTLIFIALMVVANLEGLKKSLTGGPVGKYDRHYLIGLGVLQIVLFATGIGLLVGFPVAAGVFLPEIIKAVAILAASLGLSGYALFCLNTRDKKWKEIHPDLEQFKQKLSATSNAPLSEEMSTLFAQLPQKEQEAIQAQLPLSCSDPAQRIHAILSEPKQFGSGQRLLLQRGVQKSCDLLWKKGATHKALQMEELLEALISNDQEGSSRLFQRIIRKDIQLHIQVCNNVLEEFKKEMSQQQWLMSIDTLSQKKQIKTGVI